MTILITKKFKWKYINVIAGSDIYATVGGEAFQANARENGVTVVRAASFVTNSHDVASAVSKIISGNCVATVVFGLVGDAADLLREGHKQGYKGEWLFSEDVLSSEQVLEASLGEDAEELLNGVFSFGLLNSGGSETSTRFKEMWLAQQPTVTSSSSGSIVDCSNATDSSEYGHTGR